MAWAIFKKIFFRGQ